MTCSNSCLPQTDRSSFTFVHNRMDFSSANRACKQRGGNLATSLMREDYLKLNTCCRVQEEYWIGFVDDNKCSSRSKPYHLVNAGRSCRNADPLRVTYQPTNGKCRAIAFKVANSNREDLKGTSYECSQEKYYICQVRKMQPETAATTKPTSRTSKPTPTETTALQTSSSSLPRIDFNSVAELNANHFPNTTSKSASTFNNGAVIGATLGSLVLLLFLFLLLLFLWRKRNGKKCIHVTRCNFCPLTNSLSFLKTKSNDQVNNNTDDLVQNHGYYSIRPSFTMQPDNISRESFRFDDPIVKDGLSRRHPEIRIDFKNQNLHQCTTEYANIIGKSSLNSHLPKDDIKPKFDPDANQLREDRFRGKETIDFVEIKSPQDTSVTYARVVKPKEKLKLVVKTEITC